MYKCSSFTLDDSEDDETIFDEVEEIADEKEKSTQGVMSTPPQARITLKTPEATTNSPIITENLNQKLIKDLSEGRYGSRRQDDNRQIPEQTQPMIFQILNSVASSLMTITKPICALSNKVKILRSFLNSNSM